MLPRLADNARELAEAYALVADAVGRGRQITPAAEWFVDNYHLIEEHIRIARQHLPPGYSRELPRLVGAAGGLPRVYDLALELISHAHGSIDVEAVRGFVTSYQTVQPLLLGELWAIPIMLRLALLENLRRVIAAVTAGRQDREQAGYWADQLLEVAASDPSRVVLVLAQLVDADPPLTDAFVSELASRLQGQGASSAFPVSWLEQKLAERGQTIVHAFQLASQSQAQDQVSVGNSITSLRLLTSTDWRDFVEETSAVERTLRTDPSGAYATMDFATRDRYRHVVEDLARGTKVTEVEVATRAVELAAAQPAGRTHHVGYFLIDRGRRALAVALGRRIHPERRLRLPMYIGSIGALTGAAVAGVAACTPIAALSPAVAITWLVVSALCASQLAISVVHWIATLWIRPGRLPRLDFSTGIAAEHRTIVAIPTMLTSASVIDELVDAIELRFLANRDPNLAFALVGDFRDAATEHVEGDAALVGRAIDAIAALNTKYPDPARGGGFFLFHRARRWNPCERAWMGWERKRGKLEDFNAALRGTTEGFTSITGPLERLAGIRYVIALDSDTELPRDSARELAATLAHPLNRPVWDATRGRVTEGYAILQPRVAITLASSGVSRFSRLFAGENGIDPYTREVSDVYQDVFGEGSFIGKGIYDIDAVMQAMGGRLPDNRVLSHDLLEGAYGRAGLVSDILLFEDFPAAHAVDASRRSRWIRGDWQIARWLLRRVPGGPGGDGQSAANPISLLSQWKILDNLRRSLVPIAVLALLVLTWCVPGVAVPSLVLVAATVTLPGLLGAATAATRRAKEITVTAHVREVTSNLGQHALRELVTLACLPYDAMLNLIAISRATVRVLLLHRKLLEWRTAADAQRAKRRGFLRSFVSMWVPPVLGFLLLAGVAAGRLEAAWLAAPLGLAWIAAPALVWWLARPLAPPASGLSTADVVFLQTLARRTWHYFETYVAAEDNDLPPDNFQEAPPVGIAHRTSPTNIGLALLANLGAYDLGFTSATEVIARTGRTFATLDKLPRFRGHFYNWYDTRTLEPLRPMYISTVDSGNLSGHLLTLATGLAELSEDPVIRPRWCTGAADSLAILEELGMDARALSPARALLASPPRSLSEAHRTLTSLVDAARALILVSATGERMTWCLAFEAQCERALAELVAIAPWLALEVPAEHRARLDAIPSLAEVARLEATLTDAMTEELRAAITLGAEHAAAQLAELRRLTAACAELGECDWNLVYERGRELFSIGYNVAERRLDVGFYDLLASEARLASFVAIAYDAVPQSHWFHLGRLLTTTAGRPALLSWSGSMFEYLMPLLVMPTYEGTLLDATNRAAVARQIEHGRERGVPWGVSEAGYNKFDAQLNYQYRAFGVPGLGFKRGLADDLVIAPYACALALMVTPEAACANLRRLVREGRCGALGMYEAVDYTPSRIPPDKTSVSIKSYMAHHQGMTLLSLVYTLADKPMQRRFLADPALRATELLLHERVPRTPRLHPHPAEVTAVRIASSDTDVDLRVFSTPNTPSPEVQLLSNGTYHVAITNAGGGYSRWRDIAVTRWQEDATRDPWGTFGYLRDVTSGSFWSIAHQPTLRRATSYEAIFSQGRAEFRRRDEDIETHVEISVCPEDDVELRRITLVNRGKTKRTLELTSLAEVVLAPPAADAAHRTFSNLFVQTELVAGQALLCTRRPRSPGEKPPWMLHLMTVHGAPVVAASYETDRMAFIGRNRSAVDPAAMHAVALSNSLGAVLDPIVAIRKVFELDPDATVQINLITGIAETRAGACSLVDKYSDRRLADRVLDLSWTQSQVLQRRLEATSADMRMWERLAGNVLYLNPALRAPRSVLEANRLGQSGLWAYGISGDLPIVLVKISAAESLDLVRQLVRAHAYWRLQGLSVDLVVWNDDPSGYRQSLHELILGVIASVGDANLVDRPGGVFIRRGDQIAEADGVLLQTLARAVITDAAGTLAEQLDRRQRVELGGALAVPKPRLRAELRAVLPDPERRDLVAFNGHGGFTQDGREYVITTHRDSHTPAPWVNVLANSYFGTVVSESGSAYTWCENAHSYRLTPWENDPVGDPSGEALYIRDEEDGTFWSPTPSPAPGGSPYTTRHGFGYSVFETVESAVHSEVHTFVATDAPVKFLVVKLTNRSGRTRRLSLSAMFELVLGSQRPANAPHVITEVDVKTGALFARNPYSGEFAPRIAFLECSESTRFVTGDRLEFLGRNGQRARPAAMTRVRLSGRVGAGLDPCLAMQVPIELADGQEREVVFSFGSGRDLADARHIVTRVRGTGGAWAVLEAVWAFWNRTLGAVNVQTPDPTVNFLANGWLVYQVLASRIWGRSGFYQSGGAFGFRDQLQDAMAMVHAEPTLLREQLLRAAAHQFPQGDVQHWWHPPLGRGVRTRISDDYLWLPYAVCRYVDALGDTGVLDEPIEFIEGRAVNHDEDSYYDLPTRSPEMVPLYEHCVRAIKNGLRFGVHGLPLMGTGDWNDGMNLVGDGGRGESVWLGFFLFDVLTQFAVLARRRADVMFADACLAEAAKLRAALEAHGWDGAWYRRAYFDDGAPLGSASSPECQLDSLPQSWAVLSKAGAPERAQLGMAAVDARLVDRPHGLIKLFDPPFDESVLEPGYVKGYVPGVRENGGQYTHAAVWVVMAEAAAGDPERAWELFHLINPIRHGQDPAAIATYRVEPYVVAADVYTNPQHIGRGGWTWYTGSAGWMYRLVIESLLGLQREVDRLRIAPLLPAGWDAFDVHYRHHETVHHIHVQRVGSGRSVSKVVVDGREQQDHVIPLSSDRREHWVVVDVGG